MAHASLEDLLKQVLRRAAHEVLLERLAENLQRWGDAVWIKTSDTGNEILFSEAEPKSACIASALTKRGLGKGQGIAMFADNHVNFLLPPLAAWRCGAFVTLVGLQQNDDIILAQLLDSKPTFLFCDKRTAPRALKAAPQCPFLREIVVIDGEYEGCTPLLDLLDDNGNCCPSNIFWDFENDLVVVSYSSGTTGNPKGVMHTQRSVATVFSSTLKMSEFQNITYFVAHRMYHISGFMSLMGALVSYHRCITLTNFTNEGLLKAIHEDKPSFVFISPATIAYWVKDDRISNYDVSSVAVIITGGSPLLPHAEDNLKKKFPNLLSVAEAYGLTECLSISYSDPANPKGRKAGSVGKVGPKTIIRIVNEEGNEVGTNQTGEIEARSVYLMKGYLNKPGETAAALRDDWLRTGDVGYIDDDGFLFITDRIKEMLKVDGCQVAPAVIERVLLQHGAIQDCAVVGVPHEIHGQVPKAFVVPQPYCRMSREALIRYVNERVSEREQLKGGLDFVGSIPRNEMGKVIRRKLLQNDC